VNAIFLGEGGARLLSLGRSVIRPSIFTRAKR